MYLECEISKYIYHYLVSSMWIWSIYVFFNKFHARPREYNAYNERVYVFKEFFSFFFFFFCRLESSPNIKHHLKEMGMVDLFDQEKADLSGLDPKLFVSDVFHKAFIGTSFNYNTLHWSNITISLFNTSSEVIRMILTS